MRNKILIFFLAMLLSLTIGVHADWYYSAFTGTMDYYEKVSSADMGDFADVDFTGVVAGSLIFRNAANTTWLDLAPGSLGQALLMGVNLPAWSTATYPATTTINQILYSSAANTITGIATFGSGLLTTDAVGIPSIGFDIPTAITIGASYIYRVGGTDVAVADGGTGLGLWTTGDLVYASGAGTLAGLADVAVNQVLTSGGVGVAPAWSASPVLTSVEVSSYIGMRSNAEARFYDNGNYVGFEAPALGADQIWVLPNADGSASEFLQTDGGGNLTWATAGVTEAGLRFLDNFDDASRHWGWYDNAKNGTITESGDIITLAIANTVNGGISGGQNNGPRCLVGDPGAPFEVKVKLNSYTVNNCTQAGICITSNSGGGTTAQWYLFGRARRDEDALNGLAIAGCAAGWVASNAVTTLPIYLRVRITVLGKDEAAICEAAYSTDDISYTVLNTFSMSAFQDGYKDNFVIGIFARNRVGSEAGVWVPAISAPFEWYKMGRTLGPG